MGGWDGTILPFFIPLSRTGTWGIRFLPLYVLIFLLPPWGWNGFMDGVKELSNVNRSIFKKTLKWVANMFFIWYHESWWYEPLWGK